MSSDPHADSDETVEQAASGTEETISVEMTPEEWDVVIHALEEEMDQLAPPEGNWIGMYPGEEDAVAIGEVHERIVRSLDTEADHD